VQYARQNISASNTVDQLVGAGSAPRWQHVLVANLDQERWLGTLLYRYRDGYPDDKSFADGSRRRVASYSLWDAQAQFVVAQNVKLIIGVQNLFDTKPPYSNTGDPALGYDPYNADPRGRRWTVGLRASWT
jgi:iron complex outermembrane receptor protein